ncbi:MAG: MMPL family transporter [Clostridiales bacterium]|nr:MMPL family transporter [Clostridiales bacterium]
MQKLARFIVNKRWLLLAVFVAIIAYCIYGMTRIEVEYNISAYLPSNTDTSRAIKIMDSEFANLGSATVLVKDISGEDADALAREIRAIDGVSSFTFDSSDESCFKNNNALFSVFFTGGSNDQKAVAAYDQMLKTLNKSGYKYSVPTPLVNNYAETLASEVVVVLALAAAVIFIVLLFTSKSFAEVLAFPIVFIVAALLNVGTNYWLGKISFVSNTVCIILQLALAIDYAIILCHRFTEEKDKNPNAPKAALIAALSKAIPEIASSSLTTVSGLVALMFMQLGLGFDLGMVLAKSIICSLITVFFLMPCILMILSKPMDKTRHRNFVPSVRFIGGGVVKARYAVLAAFVALFAVGTGVSRYITYCYSQNAIDTSRPTATMIAQREQAKLFGVSNTFVILVPDTVDEKTQREILDTVQNDELITSALGWAGIALPSRSQEGKSYYLTDSINYLELDDIAGVGEGTASLLFTLYAFSNGDNPADLAEYRVPAAQLFDYIFASDFIMNAAGESVAPLVEYKSTLEFGKQQLVGKRHYRLVFNIASGVQTSETFEFIKKMTPKVKSICPQAIFAGESMSAYDLNASFSHDNILITLLTIAFIYIILAFTFRSWGIPIVLVLVIQGAIFMNFSLPVIMGNNLFFFTYLIVSAIQMGATIDYAILLTNRFRQTKTRMDKRTALTESISAAFPTIITSGTIMTIASYLVGFLTSDPLISSMGMTLGAGTLISMFCVLTALPALLFVLDPLLDKTVLKGRLKAKNIKMPNPSLPPSAM